MSKKIFIFSLIITLPINIIFTIWLSDIISEYLILDKIKTTIPKGYRLHKLGVNSGNVIHNRLLDVIGYKIKTDVNIIIENRKKNAFYTTDLSKSNDYIKANVIINNKNIYTVKQTTLLKDTIRNHSYFFANQTT